MIAVMDVSNTALREADSVVLDALVVVGGLGPVNASVNGVANDNVATTR